MKKTVLITGCSSGFGRATALYFAEKGWNVIATMRKLADGKDLASVPGIFLARLDVQDSSSIETAITDGIQRFGKIDLLLNNAGFGLFGLFETTSKEKIQEQFDVNVFGVMDVVRAILPHFRQNKDGVIVNVSSGAGVFTLPMISLYCSSKFALEGFSEALSYELSSQGIVVKIVEPGGVISTNFGQRSGQEAAQASAIKDYDNFVAQTNEVFASLRGARLATENDVARAIYDASTDGTDRLRYVATEDIKPLITARRESTEENYISMMRSKFLKTQTP